MARKRGQNEGTIYKRKDGLWLAQVTIQGERHSKYFKLQSEAREWLQITNNQIRSGLTLAGAQTTLQDYLNQWLISYRSSVHPNTIFQYEGIIRIHIIPVLGHVKLNDIRTDQIQSLINAETEKGTSPRMVRYIHSVLRCALNIALKWGMIGRNPATSVTLPKLKRKEMKTLTDSQVRVFLSAAKGLRFEALFWMAVFTGLRQGELFGLKWSDLVWEKKHLQVQRQLQRIKGKGMVFTEPKTATGKRMLVLSTATIAKLREHLDYIQQERIIARDRWQEYDLMFPSSHGTPMDPSNMYKEFKETLKLADLPDIRFHDLRHTAATLMLQQGTHPKIVQERLGHSDISLTLNTYSHVLPSMQEEAAEKMDEILVPIEVTEALNKVKENSTIYEGTF
ncbi:tyrosine-type recombinase/integrase [Chloroflexota bacterium]